MSVPADDAVAQLQRELETVRRTLSAVGALNAKQAESVVEQIDRLASQVLEITPPEPWEAVHERLGTTPASGEDFVSIADRFAPPDDEL